MRLPRTAPRRLAGLCVVAGMLLLGGLPLDAQQTAPPDFSGVWLPDGRRSAGAWPKELPYTERAAAAHAEYAERYLPIDPTLDDETISCTPSGMPSAMMGIAQYPFEILTTPGQITIFMEIYGSIRRIHLDGREPPAELLPSRMGFSRGRWEGEQLVIETTHLLAKEPGEARPASLAQRVVERLTLVPDEEHGKAIRNEITVHDPLLYREPVRATVYYKWAPDVQVGEYFCTQDLWDQHKDGGGSGIPWRE